MLFVLRTYLYTYNYAIMHTLHIKALLYQLVIIDKIIICLLCRYLILTAVDNPFFAFEPNFEPNLNFFLPNLNEWSILNAIIERKESLQ